MISLQCLPSSDSLSFLICCQLFHPFLPSSSTWLNHLALCHPMCLCSLSFNFNIMFVILVMSVHFKLPNYFSHFSSNSVNKFWIKTSLEIPFNSIHSCFSSYFSVKF
jgi:hypothetical protein